VVGKLFELQNTGNEPWDTQIDIQTFPVEAASATEHLDGPDIAGEACLSSGMSWIGICSVTPLVSPTSSAFIRDRKRALAALGSCLAARRPASEARAKFRRNSLRIHAGAGVRVTAVILCGCSMGSSWLGLVRRVVPNPNEEI
jgi:hypothetical protein